VVQLLDIASGSNREVGLGHADLVRVCVHVRARDADRPDLVVVRVMLIADVLARVAELEGMQALTTYVNKAHYMWTESIMGSLGIAPPFASELSQESPSVSCHCRADVHLIAEKSANAATTGISIAVSSAWGPGGASQLATEILTDGDVDPLAARLALLSVTYRQPIGLSTAMLDSAGEVLGRWRRLTGEWAESPSEPVPPEVMARISERFERLDTAGVVELLHELASSEGVAPGAKFETFLFADRVLGLDLAQSVGQPRG
jgi:hypothetical protein